MPLKFVICGLEHSGTTLLSDVFRQISYLDAGFEVGVLLGDSPKDFPTLQPFYDNMQAGWEIKPEKLKEICEVDDFSVFYKGLQENSQVLSGLTQDIFDKTPRYFTDLEGCYRKVRVPIVATYKDPRSLVFSDYKRTGKGRVFSDWYAQYKNPKLGYLNRIYNNSYKVWKNNLDDVEFKKKRRSVSV